MTKKPVNTKKTRKPAGRATRKVGPKSGKSARRSQPKTRNKSRSQRAAGHGTAEPRMQTKTQVCIDLLSRPKGANIEELQEATGWQAHSLRGAISGTLRKKLGLTVDSKKIDGRGRVYRIVQA